MNGDVHKTFMEKILEYHMNKWNINNISRNAKNRDFRLVQLSHTSQFCNSNCPVISTEERWQ